MHKYKIEQTVNDGFEKEFIIYKTDPMKWIAKFPSLRSAKAYIKYLKAIKRNPYLLDEIANWSKPNWKEEKDGFEQ